MAKANPTLIAALRRTADKLQKGAPYQWGHMGSCNCGNLAQEITQLSKAEIHQIAMKKYGDWTEQVQDFCPTSGYPMDHMISMLVDAGLDTTDLAQLEKLSNAEVNLRIRQQEPGRYLKHNFRDDVILYLRTWAMQLEEEWLKTATSPSFSLQAIYSE
ncbi:hypothetical protein QWY31_02455 [Cytophagales bacterium LB-30]|uniref:Uncharacterized protein n=1 Tax=Shiella aurantiaca TaxID=3058365 RepID=A0ABT8F203_9BACT|nr:hypothetical protein [Shiella aurantiaca]MDN4164343.1 hypothetical protein [Shiella aurantiaca]